MRRRLVVVGLGVVLALLAAGPAWAKGPSAATITGPGLDAPIVVEGVGERGSGGDFSSFVEAAGFWELVFGATATGGASSRVLDEPSAADLGPEYVVTWELGMDDASASVYPYSAAGPLVYVEPSQQLIDYGTRTAGGWFIAGPTLVELLNGYGVPTMEARAGPDASAAELEPAPGPEPVAGVEGAAEQAPAAPSPSEYPRVLIVLAVAIVLGAGVVWAAGRRPRRIGAP
jgi:hypothetical protein